MHGASQYFKQLWYNFFKKHEKKIKKRNVMVEVNVKDKIGSF